MDNNKSIVSRIAIFGGGCFWCTEAIFRELDGVLDVMPGYIGGHIPYPTYEKVSAGTTGHVEAVMILYDVERITYDKLLEVFFATHDPTQINRQGNDIGTQYRSAIFYTNEPQKQTAETYIRFLTKYEPYHRPIVTEVVPASEFWPAEDYHKNYLENHPKNPYCQYIILPKLEKFRDRFDDLLKG